MNQDELKEVMELLRASGMRPQLCTQAVPVSTLAAKCGLPTDIDSQDIDDYIALPKALVGLNPEMMIPVSGDSMTEAGYDEGDLLRVRFGVAARDLDDVLVTVDGLATVKTLFTDDQGQRWLVPRNPKYRAIALSEEQDVRLLGVVVSVQKRGVRASSGEAMKAVRRARSEMQAMRRLSAEEVDRCLVKMGPEVRHARQWFAVMRPLVDGGLMAADGYQAFCQRIAALLPDHDHLPVAKELSRMAVQSFSKPVALWDEQNAPVRGTRFRDYKALAMMMEQLMSDR